MIHDIHVKSFSIISPQCVSLAHPLVVPLACAPMEADCAIVEAYLGAEASAWGARRSLVSSDAVWLKSKNQKIVQAGRALAQSRSITFNTHFQQTHIFEVQKGHWQAFCAAVAGQHNLDCPFCLQLLGSCQASPVADSSTAPAPIPMAEAESTGVVVVVPGRARMQFHIISYNFCCGKRAPSHSSMSLLLHPFHRSFQPCFCVTLPCCRLEEATWPFCCRLEEASWPTFFQGH